MSKLESGMDLLWLVAFKYLVNVRGAKPLLIGRFFYIVTVKMGLGRSWAVFFLTRRFFIYVIYLIYLGKK